MLEVALSRLALSRLSRPAFRRRKSAAAQLGYGPSSESSCRAPSTLPPTLPSQPALLPHAACAACTACTVLPPSPPRARPTFAAAAAATLSRAGLGRIVPPLPPQGVSAVSTLSSPRGSSRWGLPVRDVPSSDRGRHPASGKWRLPRHAGLTHAVRARSSRCCCFSAYSTPSFLHPYLVLQVAYCVPYALSPTQATHLSLIKRVFSSSAPLVLSPPLLPWLQSSPAITQLSLPTTDRGLMLRDVPLIWVIRVECLGGADTFSVFPLWLLPST